MRAKSTDEKAVILLCESCGLMHDVRTIEVGRSFPCKDCGRILTVPTMKGVDTCADTEEAEVPFPQTHCDLQDSREGIKEIGGCRIDKLLGRGAMGSVYRATQIFLDRPVAVKVLADEYGSSDRAVLRFEREARVVGALNHANVVQTYDMGRNADGDYYIVMELVEGPSLRTRAKEEEGLAEKEALRIVAAAARGLEEAHRAGVVHRDVKPDNILVDGKGRVKIADFGLARIEDARIALTQKNKVIGTPAFMSPEQARITDADRRSDVYSLGATLYYLLTGTNAYETDSIYVLLATVGRKPAPSVRDKAPAVSEATAYLVRKAMASDPLARFQRAEDFARAVDAVLDHLGTEDSETKTRGMGEAQSKCRGQDDVKTTRSRKTRAATRRRVRALAHEKSRARKLVVAGIAAAVLPVLILAAAIARSSGDVTAVAEPAKICRTVARTKPTASPAKGEVDHSSTQGQKDSPAVTTSATDLYDEAGAWVDATPASPVKDWVDAKPVPKDDKAEDTESRRSPQVQEPTVHEHVMALGSNHTADEATLALVKSGEEAVPALVKALTTLNGRGRANAALVLGRIHSALTIPALMGALSDQEVEVRASAALSLGRLGAVVAIPALMKALADDAMETSAIRALSTMGRPAVKALVNSMEEDGAARARTVNALKRMGDPALQQIIALLDPMQGSPVMTRFNAVVALRSISDQIFNDDYVAWSKWYRQTREARD